MAIDESKYDPTLVALAAQRQRSYEKRIADMSTNHGEGPDKPFDEVRIELRENAKAVERYVKQAVEAAGDKAPPGLRRRAELEKEIELTEQRTSLGEKGPRKGFDNTDDLVKHRGSLAANLDNFNKQTAIEEVAKAYKARDDARGVKPEDTEAALNRGIPAKSGQEAIPAQMDVFKNYTVEQLNSVKTQLEQQKTEAMSKKMAKADPAREHTELHAAAATPNGQPVAMGGNETAKAAVAAEKVAPGQKTQAPGAGTGATVATNSAPTVGGTKTPGPAQGVA